MVSNVLLLQICWGLVCAAGAADQDSRVPQMLLPALHSQEVQAALGLESADQDWLEDQFRELDGPWWQARILPAEKQLEAVAEIETKLRQRITAKWTARQLQRVEELVVQAQGTRALLRIDIAEKLKLTTEQQKQLDSVVATTMELQTKLESQRQSGGDVVELQKQWQQQQLKEREESIRLLDTNQQRVWLKLNGEPVDLAKAQRIYPMAPDFAKSSNWLGQSPGSIGELKGKVVVIHFYAFQCINCQRNFHHYNSWNEQWAGQDVVVVGIQTPETTAESDILLVRQALEKDKFKFPVIMDSDKANWKAWGNTMWPTVYVVDKRGYIRMWWQGELNWQGATGDQRVTELVKQLLEE